FRPLYMTILYIILPCFSPTLLLTSPLSANAFKTRLMSSVLHLVNGSDLRKYALQSRIPAALKDRLQYLVRNSIINLVKLSNSSPCLRSIVRGADSKGASIGAGRGVFAH